MCSFKCALYIGALIALLAWLFGVYPWPWYLRRQDPPLVSYDGRIAFNLDELHTPKSHDEIVDIVRDANNKKKSVRVLAAGHSWSEIAQTQDIMLSLHDYSGLVNVDKESLLVTVKAGTQLRILSELLEEEGLAMINLGSVAYQSIAGAISTATHGTGITVGNLATLVTKLKFVSGTGETIVVSEDDEDPSIFKAAVVSVGMFGVLSEITLHVDHAFNLKERRTPQTLDFCLDHLDRLVNSHQYVKFWVEFYNNFCVVYETNRTDEDIGDNPGKIESFLTDMLSHPIPHSIHDVGFRIHGETLRVDKSYLIFNDYFELPIHQESEIIVPYEHSVELVQTIRDVVLTNNFPVDYITEVRFIKGDDNYLSPSFGMGQGSCAVTLTIYGHPSIVNEYFDAVYKATRKFDGRIHWGKYFTATADDFQEWYPNFQQFAALRKKYDPKGVFLNQFLREKFGFAG